MRFSRWFIASFSKLTSLFKAILGGHSVARTPGAFRIFFTLGACLLLLPLKMIRGWNSELLIPLLSSWVADSCFLLWLCWLGILAGGSRPMRRRIFGGIIFLGLEIPLMLVINAHSYYLPAATARQFSLLDASPDAVSFFLRGVVPAEVLWSAIVVFSVLCAAALIMRRRIHVPRRGPALITLAVLSIAALIHQGFCEFYPSVLWEVARDAGEAYSHPAIGDTTRSISLTGEGVGRQAEKVSSLAFDRVIVFVMESIPLRELQEGMAELPADSFFRHSLEHAHLYSSYFSTNQDSRTGMLAMLFGRLVPFEAYSDRDEIRYDFLKQERSLVDHFAGQGYATVMAASQTDEELVVSELPWSKQILLSAREFANHGPFLCFSPYEFEHNCEDKILLPSIEAALAAHERILLFQEAVFGHFEDYNDVTGKSSVQYYGEYLQELTNLLRARGLLDRTLIVVTSDHGNRGWDYRRFLWTYRLPLMFINPRFSHEEKGGLYNQSDFAALLAAEMGGSLPPAPRAQTLFVGSSNSSLVGSITAEGDLLLVKDRKWRKYVLADGHCSKDVEPDAPARRRIGGATLVKTFEEMRQQFENSKPQIFR